LDTFFVISIPILHHSITPSLHHSSSCSFPIATDIPITNSLDSHPQTPGAVCGTERPKS
jgi:NADPH-dependent 2,4-dienoyl-CoA reductase/sulfur reductase-like enzyme